MAHALHLSAQEILKGLKDKERSDLDHQDKMVRAVSQLSLLCHTLESSPILRGLMQKFCQEKNLPYKIPVIDLNSRWDSALDMLSLAVEYKEVIFDSMYGAKDRQLVIMVSEDTDWTAIEQLINICEPFKLAKSLISEGTDWLMIANMIPLYYACAEKLAESLEDFDSSDAIYVGMKAGKEKLTCSYDTNVPTADIALLLNPAWKKSFLEENGKRDDQCVQWALDKFTHDFDFYKTHCKNVAAAQEYQNAFASVFAIKKRRMDRVHMEEEYVRYFIEPLLEPGTDVLKFWKENSVRYPVLSTMAKDYLTIQGSSVPAERIFSSDVELVTPARCLEGRTVEVTQFLKCLL